MQHQTIAQAAESIERRALNDFYRAAPDTARAALGLERMEVAGAMLFSARNEPSVLLNRVIGLGVESPVSRSDIARIRAHYQRTGITEYFLHVQPWLQPALAWNWLFEAGLARDRGWTQFVRGRQPPAASNTSLRVECIGRGHAMDFARIAAQGFELSDAAIPALAAMVGLPGWFHYMTFSGDQPAGCAALRIEGEVAWLDWAATRPEFRGRGSQTALLGWRIRKALDAGCHSLFTETGEAVPGDPQHSFRNLVRAGFIATHTRDNFAPCQPSAAKGRIQIAGV